jgi:gliding motility-associated-like protein
MTKLYKLLFYLLISVKSIACDDSSFSLINQTDNGDGTYTYEIELCNQMLGLEGIPDGFELVFSGGTFTNILSFSPNSLFTSGSDEYIGTIQGAGTSIVWALQTIFPVHNSNLFCNNISITTQGEPGLIDIDYHQGYPGCTDQFIFPLSPACEIELALGNQTPCDLLTNTYTQEIIVSYENPPASGTLDVNGQSFAITPSPQTITLTGLIANGNPVNVSASFSAEATCSIVINGLFISPLSCICAASAGTTEAITSDASNTDFILCFNETIELTSTGYTLPNASPNSSMGYALYTCLPTTNNPTTDVCFSGQYVIGDVASSVNDGTFAPAIAAPNQTIWMVPITMDMATPPLFNHDIDGDGCFAMGTPIEITYLNPITTSEISDCGSGTVNINVSGGFPEFFIGDYNLINTGSGTLSATTINNSGGSVTISGLINGDTYGLSITDDNGCSHVISGVFTCFECGSCSTPDCLIAGAYPDYETAADPMNQCSQINLMASNPINGGEFTSYHQVVSSPDGTLGVIITSGVNDVGAGSCTVNRLANLYPINGPCTIGTGIVPIPPAQGWFPIYNPEFTGLTPNTTYILQVTFTVPLGCELVNHCESYYYPEICQITDVSGVILNCDPVDNTYSAEVTVSYSSNPENGTLDIYMPDSQSFAITSSPQTVVINGLIADGQLVDVNTAFSAENNCSYSALDLFEAPSIPNLQITDPEAVCEPQYVSLSAMEITEGSTGEGSLSYWTDAGATSVLLNESAITSSGVYYIQSENSFGCIDIEAVNVSVNPLPNAPIVSNSLIYCNNQELNLMEAQGSNGIYTWYSDLALSQVIGNGSTYLPESLIGTTSYFVTASESNCEGPFAQIEIEIQDCGIVIPTAFTPDGDNLNDLWNIENIDAIYPKNRVFVYNRWGNLIYESIEGGYNQMQWNGSYNGESLPVGTYYFIIEYNDNFTKSSNGIVTIIK